MGALCMSVYARARDNKINALFIHDSTFIQQSWWGGVCE